MYLLREASLSGFAQAMSSLGSLVSKNKGSRLTRLPFLEPYGPAGSTGAPADLDVIHRLFGRSLHRYDGDVSAALGFGPVGHATVDQGEQRIIPTQADIFAR